MAKRKRRCFGPVPGLTASGRKLLDVLNDGQPHSFVELLYAALETEQVPKEFREHAMRKLRVHITFLRRLLRPLGRDIWCVSLRGINRRAYLQVRHLHGPDCRCGARTK